MQLKAGLPFNHAFGKTKNGKIASNIKRHDLTISCLTLYILCIFATSPRATVVAVSTPIHTTDNGNLTFALTATNAGDIYMHLSAPATHQWVVVGTESEMDGSVMFILYEHADKTSQYPFCYFATRNIYLTKDVALSKRL
jgi:hypothetical protein